MGEYFAKMSFVDSNGEYRAGDKVRVAETTDEEKAIASRMLDYGLITAEAPAKPESERKK